MPIKSPNTYIVKDKGVREAITSFRSVIITTRLRRKGHTPMLCIFVFSASVSYQISVLAPFSTVTRAN